jgi:hypothetical protein
MKPDKWRKQSGGNSRFRPQDDKLSCGQLAPGRAQNLLAGLHF